MYSYHGPLTDPPKRDRESPLLTGEKVSTPDYGTYPVFTVETTPLKSVDHASIDLEEQEDNCDQRIKDSGHSKSPLAILVC
jgi:hypothetical protein